MAFTRATLLLGAALVLGSAQGVLAADLGSYGGSIKDGPMMAPMEAPRPSVYFRVDGGYGSFDDPTMTESDIYHLSETSIDSAWSVGGGVGMYFSNGFRGDLTLDRRFEADATGSLLDQFAALPGRREFGIKSTVALANLYYDFDAGGRFSPYVGLGLGFTRNETTAGTVTDPCGCLSGTIDGDTETHVAGAAMAGFTMKLRDRLSLDAGYRFLYLGEAATGPVTATYNAAVAGGHGAVGVVSQDPDVEDIHAHEFRFGLRYDIR